MLETREERVRLLKAGITDKTLEKLYVTYNHFKVVEVPVRFELVEVNKSIYNPVIKSTA